MVTSYSPGTGDEDTSAGLTSCSFAMTRAFTSAGTGTWAGAAAAGFAAGFAGLSSAGATAGKAAAQAAAKNTKKLALRIRFIRAGTRTPTAVSDNGAGNWFNPKARQSSRA